MNIDNFHKALACNIAIFKYLYIIICAELFSGEINKNSKWLKLIMIKCIMNYKNLTFE